MDPSMAFLAAEAMKLALQGIFTLAEMAGVPADKIDEAYAEAKGQYETAKKALGG